MPFHSAPHSDGLHSRDRAEDSGSSDAGPAPIHCTSAAHLVLLCLCSSALVLLVLALLPPVQPATTSPSSPASLLVSVSLYVQSLLSAVAWSAPLPPPPLPFYSSPNRTCMLVRAYTHNFKYVHTLMALLRYNAQPPLVLFHTTDVNSSVAELQRLVDQGNQAAGYLQAHVQNITADMARSDFPALGSEPEFGFSFTDAAMSEVRSSAWNQHCDWCVITNVDNVYVAGFMDRVLIELNKGYQLVGFNFVSRYDRSIMGIWPDNSPGSSDDGTRKVTELRWEFSWVDMGAAIWNCSLWTQLNLNLIQLGRARGRLEYADGQFYETLAHAGVPRVIIRQVLFVHQ